MEPLKRQQRKVDNEYTIMFIPHRGKEPKSFSFRASLLKKIGIFCGILLLAMYETGLANIMTEMMDCFCDNAALRERYVFQGIASLY